MPTATSLQVKNPSMLSYQDLKPEQIEAIDRLYETDHTLLIAFMGAGKSVVSMTAMQDLLNDNHLKRILVIAPLKVCNSVWASEPQAWEHLQHLNIAIATGTPAQRKAACESDAKIVVTNFENIPWLVQQPHFDAFDGLLVDELTKFKAGGSQFKKLRKFIKQFKWRVGMTGTLVSEDVQSIFYQAMIIDDGHTFGKNKSNFLNRYFYPTDFNGYKWEAKAGAEAEIVRLFKPYMHTMPDYRDTLPPLHVRVVDTPLPLEAQKIYDDMRKQMGSEDVTIENAAVLTGKLQQVASGFVYNDAGETVEIHHAKFEKLGKIVRQSISKNGENGSSGVLIIYQFKEELNRLRQLYPDAPVLGAGITPADTVAAVDNWNKGRLNVMLLHPRSAGHGLNLARGGSIIVWLSPVWSRDLFDQTNARLHRRGQTQAVECFQLVAADTVEPLILSRVANKADYMTRFIAHLKAD